MKYFSIIILALLIGCPAVWGKEFYVAVDGCNTNSGTQDKPWATLQVARNTIRDLRKSGTMPPEAVTIYLRGGDYFIGETCIFDHRDGGIPGHPVVYRAYPNEWVRLIGGRILNPDVFKPVSDPKILQRLPKASHTHILQADLKSLGIADYGVHKPYGHGHPVVSAPLELFFNHQPMQLAHYPNQGDIKIGKVIDPGSVRTNKDEKNIRGGTFEFTDDRHLRWIGVKDVWLEGSFKYGFADDYIQVASIDPQTRQVKLAAPHLYGLDSGRDYQKYIAMNLLEELDRPGEWYLDRDTGMLYFWPPADIRTAEIAVSILEDPLIALDEVSNLQFQSLSLEISRGIGIYMEDCRNISITGCVLRNLGTVAVLMGPRPKTDFLVFNSSNTPLSCREMSGSEMERGSGSDNGVLSCDIYNTGSGGVVLSGGDRHTLVNGNCYVVNCRIHDYNRRDKFVRAGVSVVGCGNRVAHNEIYNTDFHGIFSLGNEHVFEYNHIHHVAQNSDDTSAWYTGRNPSYRGNIIRYNFIHHVGRLDRMVMGVYFDDATCDVLVEGNVFYQVATHGTIFSNCGHDNRMQNNIFIECAGPAVKLSSMFYTWGVRERKELFSIYRKGLADVNYQNPPYSIRYPDLLDFLDPIEQTDGEMVGMRPHRNQMARNVIYNCKEKLILEGPYAQFDDIDNFETNTDPGFVDAAHLNFQLKEDSIVYQKIPQFKPIPFEKIGLFMDKFRTTD